MAKRPCEILEARLISGPSGGEQRIADLDLVGKFAAEKLIDKTCNRQQPRLPRAASAVDASGEKAGDAAE